MDIDYKYWLEALRSFVRPVGDTKQIDLARALNVSAQHVNDIVKCRETKEGFKRASPELQSQMADYFNLTWRQMIDVGERLLSGEAEPFEGFNDVMKLPPEHRAWKIVDIAATKCGVLSVAHAVGDKQFNEKPLPMIERYLRGELTEKGLYVEAMDRYSRIARKIDEMEREE